MNPLKIIILLLNCCLVSCHREEPDQIVTQSMAFGIEPYRGDSSQFVMCGTGMAELLRANADLRFMAFWESFYKDLTNRNYTSLIKKTHFPLHKKDTGKGQDSIVSYGKKNFRNVFSEFLSAETGGQTRLDRLTPQSFPPYVPAYEDSVIIEGLVFEKIKGDWFLSALGDNYSK